MTSKRERYIAEYDGGCWLLMLPDGTIKGCSTAAGVLARIKAHARRAKVDIHIGEIEWRNTPAGFETPR